jgi:membrane protease YdiL (CAAX protease family)
VKLVQTSIGRQLQNSPGHLIIACAIGIAATIGDLILESIDASWLIALGALAIYLHLVQGDLASVGLTAKPIQGWRYWVRATLIIGLAVLCCIAVGWSVWIRLGRELPVYTIRPGSAGRVFFSMCVVAPIREEFIYRLALCVSLAGLPRPWTAVTVSGLAFAALHIVHGNPSPENLVGGFFLAWAYLKSGSIYIPILLHSLGNFVAWAGQVAAWYWLQGTM